MPTDVSDSTLDSAVKNNKDKLVLVDFWADWCGPCHVLAPTLERLENDFDGRLVVLKLNVDENPHAAEAFQIQGLPTLITFRNGEPDQMITGVVPYHNLKNIVQRLLP